jgi:type IV pilus assembly protein PilN
MIRINLLPHREQKRIARQRQFNFIAGGTAVFALLTVVLVHGLIAARIENQANRNSYLEAETAKLDKQIAEIKKLKEQTQALLARKQVVETLQTNRSAAVHLLDQLVRQLPDGVYLKAVKQTGNDINLQGYAQSNARVATLMRNLDASPWLMSPNLIETKGATVNNLRVTEFSLNVKLVPEGRSVTGAQNAPASQPAKDKKA